MRTKLFLDSTQNQRCFNVEIYRRINVAKSTLNQRGYHVDRRRDVISTYINVESMLSVCWDSLVFRDISLFSPITSLKTDSGIGSPVSSLEKVSHKLFA